MNGFPRLLLGLFTGWEFLAAMMRLVSLLHVYLYEATTILASNLWFYLTIPTTWPLSTGNSIQWQYKVVHHFQVRLPKSYMHESTVLFKICLCVLKVPPPPSSPPPHPKQHRLTNALHMTAQNDAKEET